MRSDSNRHSLAAYLFSKQGGYQLPFTHPKRGFCGVAATARPKPPSNRLIAAHKRSFLFGGTATIWDPLGSFRRDGSSTPLQSRRRESNPRPPDPKSGAIPLRYFSMSCASDSSYLMTRITLCAVGHHHLVVFVETSQPSPCGLMSPDSTAPTNSARSSSVITLSDKRWRVYSYHISVRCGLFSCT